MTQDKLPTIPFNAGHPDGGVQPIPAMTQDKWKTEARRWAKHAYCYEGMIDEFAEHFEQEFALKMDPYEAVDLFANDAGLDRADGFYGINSGKPFEKVVI